MSMLIWRAVHMSPCPDIISLFSYKYHWGYFHSRHHWGSKNSHLPLPLELQQTGKGIQSGQQLNTTPRHLLVKSLSANNCLFFFFFQRGGSTLKPVRHTGSLHCFCGQWLQSLCLGYYSGIVRQVSMGVMERTSGSAPEERGPSDSIYLHQRSPGKGINPTTISGQWRLMFLWKGLKSPPERLLERG